MSTASELTQFYNLQRWSDNYFAINDDGQLVANIPHPKQNDLSIPLLKIVEQAQREGYRLPLIVRFKQILRDRLARIQQAFHASSIQHSYHAPYTCVYPIKVNQQHSVVAELAKDQKHFGLEAGSKAELLAILGMEQTQGRLIICNGYKDDEYIRIALIGRKMGKRVILVVEKLSELDRLFRIADEVKTEVELGIRVRMYSVNKGKWQDTGGEKAKFGLSPSQLMRAVERLKKENRLQELKLLHCHLGSQIPDLKDIRDGIRECGRHYAELCRMGAQIEYLDLGGGLGVDYDGTNSDEFNSINYNVDAYADAIVSNIKQICDDFQVPQPHLVTESGRALTAHHALILTDIIDVEDAPGLLPPRSPAPNEHRIVEKLWELQPEIHDLASFNACWEELRDLLQHAHQAYTLEEISLAEWAHCEQLYFVKCRQLLKQATTLDIDDETLLPLRLKVARKVFCNFSLFQSLPDSWGVDQLFPVLPISGLNDNAQEPCLIKDITCDSDGRIDHYVSQGQLSPILLLPPLDKSNPPPIGIFMVGAYQEILGDMHNLFGDPHAVSVDVDAQGKLYIDLDTPGDRIDELLDYVHFDKERLNRNFRQMLSRIDDRKEREGYLALLQHAMSGYTYLESQD